MKRDLTHPNRHLKHHVGRYGAVWGRRRVGVVPFVLVGRFDGAAACVGVERHATRPRVGLYEMYIIKYDRWRKLRLGKLLLFEGNKRQFAGTIIQIYKTI